MFPVDIDNEQRFGPRNTGVSNGENNSFLADVFALKVSSPEREIESIICSWNKKLSVGIFGVTGYSGPGHPMQLQRCKMFYITIPDSEKIKEDDLKVSIDLGYITGKSVARKLPGDGNEWVDNKEAGLGSEKRQLFGSAFLVEIAAAEGAMGISRYAYTFH
jgi:hypothetical protein